MGKKIAIVGMSPAHFHLAPFYDTEWEIWSLGTLYPMISRWDRWFELHDMDMFRAQPDDTFRNVKVSEFIQWLEDQAKKIPVYLQKTDADIPSALVFPRKEVLEYFGVDEVKNKGDTPFTSTIAWMTGMAIMEEPEEIAYFGVDMSSEDEYFEQRPGLQFFRGWAQALGIKLWACEASTVFQGAEYQLSGPPSKMRVILEARQKEFQRRLHIAKEKKKSAEYEETYLSGALDDLSYMLREWA